MMLMTRPAWIEVDLDNIVYNVNSVRALVKSDLGKEIKYMPVLKGGGYGHGITELAKELYNNGINYFGVAMFSEALLLRKTVKNANVLILGYTPNYLINRVIENSITQTVYSYQQAEFFSKEAQKLNKSLNVHIKLDTGMNRLGFQCNEDSADIIQEIIKLPNINVEGIFTHFATSDMKDKEYVFKQFERYKQFIRKLEEKDIDIPIKHISNTGIILDSPELNQDMVRFGSMVYGTYSSYEIQTDRVRLKDALSIKAEVAQVKELEPGEGIGYDLTYVTKQKTKIATLPIGYADIAIRKLKNKGYVLVKGIKAPIVGSVCMDQLMVDVTGIDVKMGDVATLIGEDSGNNISIKEVADLQGIDDYELVISIDKRLPKKYIKNGKVINIIDINVELSNLIL